MLKMIETDDKTEGLHSLMGKEVILFCLNYLYAGKLVGVGKAQVKLENPSIVYETGAFSEAEWKDAQKLSMKHCYVRIGMIEMYGVGKP